MRRFDFSPFYRSVVGLDRMTQLLEAAAATEGASGYPPYNIERTDENIYRIEIAVAGFAPEDLSIDVKENRLTVQARKAANDEARQYLHQGVAARSFDRIFQLADYLVVKGADLANGLLTITLERELPEQLKPRRIEIASKVTNPAIEAKPQATTKAA